VVEVFVDVEVFVETVLAVEEHAAPSRARATTHAPSPALRRGMRPSGEEDGLAVVSLRFVIPLPTAPTSDSVHRVRCDPRDPETGRSTRMHP
jgi:hypothetical protein